MKLNKKNNFSNDNPLCKCPSDIYSSIKSTPVSMCSQTSSAESLFRRGVGQESYVTDVPRRRWVSGDPGLWIDGVKVPTRTSTASVLSFWPCSRTGPSPVPVDESTVVRTPSRGGFRRTGLDTVRDNHETTLTGRDSSVTSVNRVRGFSS